MGRPGQVRGTTEHVTAPGGGGQGRKETCSYSGAQVKHPGSRVTGVYARSYYHVVRCAHRHCNVRRVGG